MCLKAKIKFFLCVKTLSCFLLFGSPCSAQSSKKKRKVVPTLSTPKPTGLEDPRPKFIELSYERLAPFPIRADSEEFGDINSGSKMSSKLSVKLNAPVVLKDKLQVIAGLRYKNEQYQFLDIKPSDTPAHLRLDDRNLTSLGFRIYARKELGNDWTLTAGLGADLNGDKIEFNDAFQFLRHNYLAVVEKQKNEYTSWGFGLAFGYDLGNPSVYPILAYRHKFNPRWAIDLYLPKSAEVRYNLSSKTYLSALAKITGGSYALKNPVLEGYDHLEYRQSRLEVTLGIEQEIHDWLWVGLKAGGLKTLRMFFTEPGASNRDRLLDLQSVQTSFLNLSIFIVPPRKLLSGRKR